MRSVEKVLKCILIAAGLWLADTFLLAVSAHMPFFEAFWQGVTINRLLFRLLLVIILLGTGITAVLRQEMSYTHAQRMRPSRRAVMFGDANSKHKSCRLLYHSLRLASVLKLSRRSQDDLRALCHCYDLGWVGNIKGDSLEARDAAVGLSAAIAANIPQLKRAAGLIACQHEYYCGGGRRDMLGKSIPIQCRIFTLALLYDDLRFGKKKMTQQEALDELDLYSGTMLDPDIVEAFRRLHSDNRTAADALLRMYVQ